ncbi:MAG: hypothetical protein ACTSU5_21830 [Promethearchaeota archaeon]
MVGKVLKELRVDAGKLVPGGVLLELCEAARYHLEGCGLVELAPAVNVEVVAKWKKMSLEEEFDRTPHGAFIRDSDCLARPCLWTVASDAFYEWMEAPSGGLLRFCHAKLGVSLVHALTAGAHFSGGQEELSPDDLLNQILARGFGDLRPTQNTAEAEVHEAARSLERELLEAPRVPRLGVLEKMANYLLKKRLAAFKGAPRGRDYRAVVEVRRRGLKYAHEFALSELVSELASEVFPKDSIQQMRNIPGMTQKFLKNWKRALSRRIKRRLERGGLPSATWVDGARRKHLFLDHATYALLRGEFGEVARSLARDPRWGAQLDLVDTFAYFGTCPVCGAKNHGSYLVEAYFSETTGPVVRQLLDLARKERGAGDGPASAGSGVTIGIPCCNCFTRVFGEEVETERPFPATRLRLFDHSPERENIGFWVLEDMPNLNNENACFIDEDSDLSAIFRDGITSPVRRSG